MEPALKQRVVGAIVLVALAVIFLPMLIKGPAPESGVSDVPLKLPEAPQGEFLDDGTETRELPLVTPGAAPASGVVGMDASQAQPGDAADEAVSTDPDTSVNADGKLPATTAGGDYAVSFGRYATTADAERVVAALRSSQLPGYQDATTDNGRTLYRVRIGPYATQADAESARLRAAHVRDDVGAKVVVLNADAAATPATAGSTSSASQPLAALTPAVSKPEALAESKPATPAKPTESKPVAKPAEAKPSTVATATKPAAKPAEPAAASTGFAVQLGAFGNAAEANKLRDRARAAGLRAFVESVRTDKGVLSRVRVGPVLTRAEA
ncbi:MAG TPA: SPOR domain-containing protein, partial [Lysobacter sp.]|nr:SPOR domain-containing protein [Lysobacter sp.]